MLSAKEVVRHSEVSSQERPFRSWGSRSNVVRRANYIEPLFQLLNPAIHEEAYENDLGTYEQLLIIFLHYVNFLMSCPNFQRGRRTA